MTIADEVVALRAENKELRAALEAFLDLDNSGAGIYEAVMKARAALEKKP